MPDLDIVIVNYRSSAHTAACVGAAHAVAAGDGVNVAVTVVNNGDARAELESAVHAHGQASFIHNQRNLGFGAACNLGAANGNAPIILFLNPDARLKPNCLRAMTSFIADPANAAVGIVGPAIEDQSGSVASTCSPLPGIASLLGRSVGFSGFHPARHHRTSGAVGQVMGAVLMIRRGLYQDLGGFDQRFFLYYEDVDLCARATKMGFLVYYLTAARAIHIGRASSAQDTGMALALYLRSRFIYARLHFGVAAEALIVAASFVAELPLRLLATARAGNSITGVAVLRAYRLLAVSLLSGLHPTTVGASKHER